MSECHHDKFLLNGKIVSGVQFDDKLLNSGLSCYEVIRIIQGKFLFIEDHLERLKTSFDLLHILYKPDIKIIIDYLLKYRLIAGITEGNIKVVINCSNNSDNKPQIIVYQIKHYYPSLKEYSNGIITSLIYGERSNPNAKFINLKIKNLVKNKLKGKIFDTLLVDRDNNITEGSKSNVFFIKGDSVITASDEKVLQGVTRKHIIMICKELNINLIYKTVQVSSLSEYDAAFISGTSVKILPVNKTGRITFNVHNTLMQKLMTALDKKIDSYIENR